MPKSIITCLDKIELAPKIYLVKFGVNNQLDFIPGQFISMEVGASQYRSYSLVCYQQDINPTNDQKSQIEFLVNTKSGGTGSQAIEKMQIGDSFTALGPLGKFALIENDRPKIFIATGTGLGPFVGMIEKILKANCKAKVDLFFGVYSLEYDFTKRFFGDYLDPVKYPNFKIITCADSLTPEQIADKSFQLNFHLGKVTEILTHRVMDYSAADFYICGNPYMVTDMEKTLQNKGASDNIYLEKYGVLAK